MPLAINHLKFKAMNKTNPFPILSGLLFCILLFMASCKPDPGAEFLYSDQFPELSPDGSMLVYFHWDYQLAESGDYPTGLYILNLEKNERRLDYGKNPTWSPDSEYIIYSRFNDDMTKELLWKISISDTEKLRLTF